MSDVLIITLAPVMPVFDFYLAFAGVFLAVAFAAFAIAFSVWAIYELKKRGSSDV